MLHLHLLALCTIYESVVVIISLMCMVPRFLLIDSELWYCLFSNYLFLVTLLNFKGVIAFMFCYHLWDKPSTTLLCFFYALDNHFAFHALYILSFVGITFHVTTWLLSFIARLYLPCLC